MIQWLWMFVNNRMFTSLNHCSGRSLGLLQFKRIKEGAVSAGSFPKLCFTKPNEREEMKLDTLTKVCNYLDVSAQQRKAVRFKGMPTSLSTLYVDGNTWRDTKGVKIWSWVLGHGSCARRARISEQIISSCRKILADAAQSLFPLDSLCQGNSVWAL